MPRRLLVLAAAVSVSLVGNAHAVADHLQCFKIKDPEARAQYRADITPDDTSIAASPGCIVKVPATLLCVDVAKSNVSPLPPGAPDAGPARKHLCYKMKCAKPQGAVPVTDQFGSRSVTLKTTSLLCAPVPTPTSTTTTTTPSSTTTTSTSSTTTSTSSSTTTTTLLGLGQSCFSNAQCASSFCVDGVCCDSSCGGSCQACVTAKTGGPNGTCANIPAGTDPDNECGFPLPVCNGAGACGF